MTTGRKWTISTGLAMAAIGAAVVVGGGATYVFLRDTGDRSLGDVVDERAVPASAPASPAGVPNPGGADPSVDVIVRLTENAVERAGIAVTSVVSRAGAGGLRLPGVVEPNAYRQVSITPVVTGRVVRVTAQLGDRVRRGQSLAEIYSPELAEARTKYVAATAMLEAHEKELQRTEKLVAIGAASRQELERIHSEHAAQTAEVESARSRLQLLGAGIDGAGASDTTKVPAPIDGVVTERVVNPGLNVDPTTKLFTIVDLSTVWVVADVYEKDLHLIETGTRATITTSAYPERSFDGQVSYIDAQINTSTRTAKLRLEVANPEGNLRLGMYADVSIEAAPGAAVLMVPKAAVQNVGARQVVYIQRPEEVGAFIERTVAIGRQAGDLVEIMSGVSAGESVVSKGSFFVRAEAEQLGVQRSRAPGSVSTTSEPSGAAAPRAIQITVGESAFEPARVFLKAGVPARLTFLRVTDKTCGTEVVFPALNLERALPLNEPVTIELTPASAGEIAFACGMNMLKGTLVVQ